MKNDYIYTHTFLSHLDIGSSFSSLTSSRLANVEVTKEDFENLLPYRLLSLQVYDISDQS